MRSCRRTHRTREIARGLYDEVATAPIISPHGHVDPRLLLDDQPFRDPAELLITRDHYVTRMLHSAGLELGEVGTRPEPHRRPPGDLAPAGGELASLRRHRERILADARAVVTVRRRRRARRGVRRSHLRPHRVRPAGAGVPPACAVRPVRHRGARDDGRSARRPRTPPRAGRGSVIRGAGAADLPPRRLRRSGRARVRRGRLATPRGDRRAGDVRRLPGSLRCASRALRGGGRGVG